MGAYLGQNFLTDSKIRHYLGNKIKAVYTDLSCSCLMEIGPGKGSLTKLIHDSSPNFFVIEKDDKLIKDGKLNVEGLEHVSVIHADVLDVAVDQELEKREQIPSKTLIVGNLPYYITSPILRKFFGEGLQNYAGGIFMVQKEVADKLDSQARKKSYLWWILNYSYDVFYLKTVPAKAFSPVPKVTSALIELRKRSELPFLTFSQLLLFLDDFAPYSRKTLGAIATMIKKKSSKIWNIPEELRSRRLEELSREEITKLIK